MICYLSITLSPLASTASNSSTINLYHFDFLHDDDFLGSLLVVVMNGTKVLRCSSYFESIPETITRNAPTVADLQVVDSSEIADAENHDEVISLTGEGLSNVNYYYNFITLLNKQVIKFLSFFSFFLYFHSG